MEEVSGGVPEQDGGDAAVGSGAGFEQACSEEGATEPGPEGLLFGGSAQLNSGVGHEVIGVSVTGGLAHSIESGSKSSIQMG